MDFENSKSFVFQQVGRSPTAVGGSSLQRLFIALCDTIELAKNDT
jgi:hypothetical protein